MNDGQAESVLGRSIQQESSAHVLHVHAQTILLPCKDSVFLQYTTNKWLKIVPFYCFFCSSASI